MGVLKECLTCKEVSDNFNKNPRNRDGLHSYCKKCQREVAKKSYLKNKDKVKTRGKLRRESIKESNLAIVKDMFGLICSHCGFTHSTTAPFDFHHTNPDKKEGLVSDMMKLVDEYKLRKELSKCILLCATCHRLEHERLRKERE